MLLLLWGCWVCLVQRRIGQAVDTSRAPPATASEWIAWWTPKVGGAVLWILGKYNCHPFCVCVICFFVFFFFVFYFILWNNFEKFTVFPTHFLFLSLFLFLLPSTQCLEIIFVYFLTFFTVRSIVFILRLQETPCNNLYCISCVLLGHSKQRQEITFTVFYCFYTLINTFNIITHAFATPWKRSVQQGKNKMYEKHNCLFNIFFI